MVIPFGLVGPPRHEAMEHGLCHAVALSSVSGNYLES